MEDEKKSEDLLVKENYLRKELEKYKKENFLLEVSISAWENTLGKKLDEYKTIESELNEIYRKIWSQRDNFCDKADEFIKEYGLFSNRRKNQIKLMSILKRNKTFNKKHIKTDFKHNEFFNFENDIKQTEQITKIIETDDILHTIHFEQNSYFEKSSLSDDKIVDLKDFYASDPSQVETPYSDNENSTSEPEEPENIYQSPKNKLYAFMDFDKFQMIINRGRKQK